MIECILGRWLNFLSIFQPFDLGVGVDQLHRQNDLLSFLTRVGGFQFLQESLG